MIEQAYKIGVWTKFLGPTEHMGARIRVTWYGGSKITSYDYAARDAHEAATLEVLTQHGFAVEALSNVASTESGRGYVYQAIVHETKEN